MTYLPPNAKVINFISRGFDICGTSYSIDIIHARASKMEKYNGPNKNAFVID